MKDFFELSKTILLLLMVILVLAFLYHGVVLSKPAAQFSKTEAGPGAQISEPATSTALVTKVIDGDTVVIEGGKSVRLLGLDADELGEVCFDVAKERLKELVLGKNVILESEARGEDVYGRLLRYMFLDGLNVDLELVGGGLAVARASYEGGKYDKEFAEAEKYARDNHLGCKWKP
ncbi:MAG: thermonuclease family protein [Candidatus Liptonbacteria bacterium]|nr:thermonuclease family protein [Candidatus Liptonbacteria bacterium]